MAAPHPIRLAGPWQRSIVDPGGRSHPPRRVTMPDDGSLADEPAGALLYTRTFHRPTGLDPAGRLLIEITSETVGETNDPLPQNLEITCGQSPVLPPPDCPPTASRWVGWLNHPLAASERLSIRITANPGGEETSLASLRATVRLLIDPPPAGPDAGVVRYTAAPQSE